MNEIGKARQALATALAPILPGRVQAYKPPTVTAPMIWIDNVSLSVVNDTQEARFVVLGIVDGADHAQYAVLDDMLARAWDAAREASRPKARSAITRDVFVDGRTYRGFELAAAVAVTGRTFCPPTVTPVTIPATEYAEV